INYHQKTIKHNHQELDEAPTDFRQQQNPVHSLSYQEMILLVQALPLAYRTASILYFLEGYTQEQLATMLILSVLTCKPSQSSARAHLRNRITQDQKEGATRHER